MLLRSLSHSHNAACVQVCLVKETIQSEWIRKTLYPEVIEKHGGAWTNVSIWLAITEHCLHA